MSKAIYHQSASHRVELDVIATRGNTVDLGRDGVVLVRDCHVSQESIIGHATLVVAAEEKKPEKTVDRMNKDELLALASERGVDVNPDMTKAQIIEALDAAAQPQQ